MMLRPLLILLACLSLAFAATPAQAHQVQLTWDTPLQADGTPVPNLAGYKLHYGSQSGQYQSTIPVGLTTTYTVTNVSAGQTYYFAVTAYNSTGTESPFSNEVSATIPAPDVQLSANPSTVTAGSTVTATWSGIANPTTTDWIGLYIAGADNTAYIDWIYINCSRSSSTARASGSCPFTVPATLAVGSYELRLLANDGFMLLATSNVVISPPSTVPTPPVANFSATPTTGAAPLPVQFTDASTGSISTWAWSFGDGTSSTARSPQHTYSKAGSYPVSLTVTGPGGSITTTKTVTVTASVPPPPVAAFSATPTSGRLPLTVTFTNTSTGSITAQTWAFGDTTSSTARTPTHTYTTAGTYPVSLTVTGPGGSHTATKTGYITVAPALVEVGDVTVDYVWKRIAFRQTFVDPIVVATPLSANDFAPATIRLRNITRTGFEIRVQEWEYLGGNGVHLPETVSYVAMERGPHTLGTGIRVEAGRLNTGELSGTSFVKRSFQQGFRAVPVVLTAVTSANEADAVTARVKGVTTRGFQVRLQEEVSSVQRHATETIDYIAWEPSTGTVDGLLFEVNTTADAVTDRAYTLRFTAGFAATPMFLAGMQTYDGSDPATLRWTSKTASQVVVQIQEESSRAHDLAHTTEVVGYIAFTYPFWRTVP